MQYLIVGLGNPGKKYINNRHNVGFLCVDFILKDIDPLCLFKNENQSIITKIEIDSNKIIFAKPQTFMNLSGNAVLSLTKFYKISPLNLIIIHDEIDLPFGKIKTKFGGSNAGHNGLKDIDQKIGNNYHRIRIGIGRPEIGINQSIADYVLSDFSNFEQKQLYDTIFIDVLNYIKKIITES